MTTVEKDKMPTLPGWYRSRRGNDGMLFSLNYTGQWHAHAANGDVTPCTWDFVAQGGPLERLTRSSSGAWVAMLILLLPIGALAFWLVSLGIAALS